MNQNEIPTPAIAIDLATVQRNLQRMADYAADHKLQLRPHIKTHKSKMVGKMQLELGAVGLTVAKVGEAEVMSDVCDDIFVAYPTVDQHRCRRIAQLAKRLHIAVGIDSEVCAEQLSQAAVDADVDIGILVDLDVGYGRTGVCTVEDSVRLGKFVQQLPGLSLEGIMVYSGNVLGNTTEQAEIFAGIEALIGQARLEWLQQALPVDVISSGSTPSAYQSHFAPSVTEIRPGTYVFNDLNIVYGGYGQLEDCAAKILSTVVSNNQKNQVVLDAGSKTLTSDLCGPRPDAGHGLILEYPEAKIVKLTEEHAQVDVSKCKKKPQLGERVSIIPNHICPCMNLQNHVWWLSSDGQATQEAVDARGLLS
ncbi:MAG: alanine racemase [Pirellulaceae bacterium]